MMGAVAASSVGARNGVSSLEAESSAGADCGSSRLGVESNSIFASFLRKPASTSSASASISVFLTARFL